jgi:purine nucleosidase
LQRLLPLLKGIEDMKRCILLLFLFMQLLTASSALAETSKRLVIMDDEGFALGHLMLLGAPDVKVLGMTSVSGNVWANRATAMALRGLELADRPDVPVVQGATFPLVNSEAQTERWEALYGKLVWKGAWMKQWVEPTRQSTPPYFGPNDPVNLAWGNPKRQALPEIAANFMIRMVRAYPGQVSIIATGPMTNLALAQRLDPEFASLAKELVYMGGSFNPRQLIENQSATEFAREFINSPRREFNIRFDPEAASIISRSPWRKITVVPVDPTTATQLTKSVIDQIAATANPSITPLISRMEAGFPMWDEIAVAVWLQPDLITKTEMLFVDYETEFGPAYGDTLSWHAAYRPGLGEQAAQVVRAINVPKLEEMLPRLIARSSQRP